MSENTLAQEMRLTRHRELQNGMELILGKLRHNAKSITTEDARSLADNAEEGDVWTANIISAVKDLAMRNKSDNHSRLANSPLAASGVPQDVLERLRTDPSSITEEDARRFSENVEAKDASSARLVSAVESLAAAHDDIYGQGSSLGDSHPSLLTVVKDLYAAVEANPEDVTPELLKTTQSIVSKMQKAIGHTNAPHPELEAELQQEYAKIVPKVERGVVTKAEADHLHSLEARAHGHTERGGLTAMAQSVAARRERQVSVDSSGNVRSRANSRTYTPHRQHHHDIVADGGASPVAPSTTSMRHYQSLSESTNNTRPSVEDHHKHSSMNATLAGLSVHDEEEDYKYATALPSFDLVALSTATSGGLENVPRAHKRENSHPAP